MSIIMSCNMDFFRCLPSFNNGHKKNYYTKLKRGNRRCLQDTSLYKQTGKKL